jgi:hypothetical protein
MNFKRRYTRSGASMKPGNPANVRRLIFRIAAMLIPAVAVASAIAISMPEAPASEIRDVLNTAKTLLAPAGARRPNDIVLAYSQIIDLQLRNNEGAMAAIDAISNPMVRQMTLNVIVGAQIEKGNLAEAKNRAQTLPPAIRAGALTAIILVT